MGTHRPAYPTQDSPGPLTPPVPWTDGRRRRASIGEGEWMAGTGTREDPWQLVTANGGSAYQMWRDEAADPPAIVCQVGSTQLRYHLAGDRGPGGLAAGAGRLGSPRRRRRAEARCGGHGRGVGPLGDQPGRRLVWATQGVPGPVWRLPAAAAGGAWTRGAGAQPEEQPGARSLTAPLRRHRSPAQGMLRG